MNTEPIGMTLEQVMAESTIEFLRELFNIMSKKDLDQVYDLKTGLRNHLAMAVRRKAYWMSRALCRSDEFATQFAQLMALRVDRFLAEEIHKYTIENGVLVERKKNATNS